MSTKPPPTIPEIGTESGRTYRLVTRYWPQVAVVLVVVAGVAEWVIEGLTANGALEVYVFAWAAISGGLWFLFDRAERALSQETRERVAAWLTATDLRGHLESIPAQFAVLFDRVFGEKHWSRKCFYRSMVASVLAATLAYVTAGGFIADVAEAHEDAELWRSQATPEAVEGFVERCVDLVGQDWWDYTADECPQYGEARRLRNLEIAAEYDAIYTPGVILQYLGGFMLLGLLLNALPDWLSLLETRWLIGRMERGRTLPLLVLDILATSTIQLTVIWFILVAIDTDARGGFPWFVISGQDEWSPFFYSAFFTSVWLWIYGLAALASQVLVRVGSGAGVLLKLTDVEGQPFRSIGFTAVLLVSVGFLVGLPFVLFV